MRANKPRLAVVGVVGLMGLSSCARNAPQDSLDPAGPIARQIDQLFMPVFWIAVGVFALVMGLLLWLLFRYRHRPGSGVPEQVHGSKRLEIAWTIAPAVLLGAIAIPTLGVIFALAREPAQAERLDIVVTAHQFWWQVEYPGQEVVTANEIHIPTGRPIYVELRGNDVVHSFWVPRLAGKQDVIPGQSNFLTLQADVPDRYFAQCAEYCGLSHANMRFWVVAESPEDFERWLEEQRQPARPPPDSVLAIAQKQGVGCGGCHTITGVDGFAGQVGPDLTHLASRETFAGIFPLDEENLRRWVHDAPGMKPGVIMPSFLEELTAEEVQALVRYLQTLE